ncbi:OLC1v1026766C1 [Oldenlandia corymbosa var. corymbosa]|uniref:OLC1v1026766C1 n=1 Tax=Oldenlandia corymbosa var. corymbosa TaxID=529605 RepID=A0AAV1C840_OLDCO|nr:OLC1v1026766C1 [Oldenlandia corymbosa var. corymbosa]
MASLLAGAAVPMASLSFSRHQSLPCSSSVSTSLSSTTSTLPLIYCGRGDRKTAKGKRFSHSFGNVSYIHIFLVVNF